MFRRFLDSPWPYFVAAALLLVVAIASQFRVSVPSRSKGTVEDIAAMSGREDLNVVFVLIDTLRADRLGTYGYERPTSPVIDELASYGLVFERVKAQSSWTKTSMASLWTGTLPARNGILRYNHVLPQEALLPAEIFKAAGYRTAGIWRNGWVAPNFGFDQGFDVYHRPRPGREQARIQRRSLGGDGLKGTDEDIHQSVVEFLESFGHDRFFLYLHYMDVHQYLFDQYAPDFGNSYSDSYDKSISWTDRLINVLIRHIDDVGVLDRTLIVIASDHGEAFLEHGFEGHARNLYREVTDVPLIFILPFLVEGGIRVSEPISNVDVWPTILDMVGLPPLEDADGRSAMPLVMAAATGGEADGERPIFQQLDRRWGNPRAESEPIVGIQDRDLSFFLPMKNPDRAELFDVTGDPGEHENLAEARPEDVARMRKLAEEYLGRDNSPWGTPPGTTELDEMRLGQLRALGYVIK